jgi:hypothetical protein
MYKYCFSAVFFLVNGIPASGNENVIPVGKSSLGSIGAKCLPP